MPVHTLHRKQIVATPLDKVFPFFERPENLEDITPPFLRFRLLSPSPVPMHIGSIIQYQLKLHGLPVKWTTIITEYDPPHKFVDVQLKGPYTLWHHTHHLRDVPGGTEVEDIVRYQLPFGPLGELMHAVLIRRDVERIFDYRARVMRERFWAPAGNA